jgi:hypothetical protein
LSEATESPDFVAAPGLAGSGAGLASAGLEAGFAAAGFDAAGLAAAGDGAVFATGLAVAEVVGFDAAAFGFAAAFAFAAAFGFAAALGLVGASTAALDAADACFGFPAAFGFALGAAVPLGLAVDDFGAPFAPALGAGFRFDAAGLREEVPAAAARAVRVEPGVEAPVLLPPARVPAGASVVSGASSD